MSKKRKAPSEDDIDRAVGGPRQGGNMIMRAEQTQEFLKETKLQRFSKEAILETLRKEMKKTRYLERAIELMRERDGTEMGKAFIQAALDKAKAEIYAYEKKEEQEGSGEQMDMSQSQDFMPPTHRMMLDEDYKRNYVPIKW